MSKVKMTTKNRKILETIRKTAWEDQGMWGDFVDEGSPVNSWLVDLEAGCNDYYNDILTVMARLDCTRAELKAVYDWYRGVYRKEAKKYNRDLKREYKEQYETCCKSKETK